MYEYIIACSATRKEIATINTLKDNIFNFCWCVELSNNESFVQLETKLIDDEYSFDELDYWVPDIWI